MSSITSLNWLRKRNIFHQMFWHYFKAGHFAGWAADTTEQIVIMLNTGPRHGTRQGHAVSVQCQLTNVKYSANLKTCRNTALIIVFPRVAGSDTRWSDDNIVETPCSIRQSACLVTCYVKGCCDPVCVLILLDTSSIITLPPVAHTLLTTSWTRPPSPHGSCYFLP